MRDNKLFAYTRQAKLNRPTFISTDIIKAAFEIFSANYTWERPLRSVGVRAINLVTAVNHQQLSLFDQDKEPQLEILEKTIDVIRSRFG